MLIYPLPFSYFIYSPSNLILSVIQIEAREKKVQYNAIKIYYTKRNIIIFRRFTRDCDDRQKKWQKRSHTLIHTLEPKKGEHNIHTFAKCERLNK